MARARAAAFASPTVAPPGKPPDRRTPPATHSPPAAAPCLLPTIPRCFLAGAAPPPFPTPTKRGPLAPHDDLPPDSRTTCSPCDGRYMLPAHDYVIAHGCYLLAPRTTSSSSPYAAQARRAPVLEGSQRPIKKPSQSGGSQCPIKKPSQSGGSQCPIKKPSQSGYPLPPTLLFEQALFRRQRRQGLINLSAPRAREWCPKPPGLPAGDSHSLVLIWCLRS